VTLLGLALLGSVSRRRLHADPAADLPAILSREIIGPRLSLTEVQDYIESRLPKLPSFGSRREWRGYADGVRRDMLENVVFRGEAKKWRDAKTNVVWLDTISGGVGYQIRKLRYEALPGLWIPALLYEPENLSGKVPVILNVNGHDGNGKAAVYKQIRCINQAKRGMLALNVEWLGMGQLRDAGYVHSRMNQLDLCGTSGLAPFYLSMKRGLDVLLSLPNADPERVAVTGLSGGGWQTIFISALDTRVTLSNPVAGYSCFRTRVRHLKDLGDSEQTPCDMATVADYCHLTAMRAPRPTLLTYNSKDDCCFESGYALPPLMNAASRFFKLFGKEDCLRSHVNDDPGTHNYEKDNRQAFYRLVGDYFFAGHIFDATEIPCESEVKTAAELAVAMPAQNENFHTLALSLMKNLPRDPSVPPTPDARWQRSRRKQLRDITRFKDYDVQATKTGGEELGDVKATFWELRVGGAWTVPAIELTPANPKATTLLIADAGRRSVAAHAAELLKLDRRVIAFDPFYLGECKIAERDFLFALLVSAIGDRPLGLQSSQIAAIARWAKGKNSPGTIRAVGPRTSLMALVAAALETKAIAGLELHGSLNSLKEIIEQDRTVDQMPEMFCFGLLEAFDLPQLTALVAPREVKRKEEERRGHNERSSSFPLLSLFEDYLHAQTQSPSCLEQRQGQRVFAGRCASAE